MIQDAIRQIVDGKDLSEQTAVTVMSEMMDGTATPAQVGSFLTAMRMKGETEHELRGFASAMRRGASRISAPEGTVDLCGTGGDGRNTINISTIASFVVAAAGVPVAKHANRAVSGRSGSADLMAALGIPHDLPPAAVQRSLDETGFGFMFAPVFHSSMRNVAAHRQEVGIRTFFNMLGPMTNPAGVRRQLIGVYDPAIASTMARAMMGLGATNVMIVHSQGLDELSNLGDTQVTELSDGSIREYRVSPGMFGLDMAEPRDLMGGDPLDSARAALSILKGERSARADAVALNAAAAIYVSGKCGDLQQGLDIAAGTLRSGRALEKLKEYAAVARMLESERQSAEPIVDLNRRRILPDVIMTRCAEIVRSLAAEVASLDGGTELLGSLDTKLIADPGVISVLTLRRIKHTLTDDGPMPSDGRRAKLGFSDAIGSADGIAVIAEYKPSSPGARPLQVPPDVRSAADAYSRAGVAAVSVLAEPEFFGGGPGVFSTMRSRITLPMLYKDFVVSEKQVKLAKALGADAVLLIADVLSTEALDTLTGSVAAKGMEPFVELHDGKDIRKLAACANARSVATVGVNSRDLRTLEIDLARQGTLAEQVPSDYLKVAESGMRSPDDLERLAGFDAVLIGSMFMQAEDLERTVTDTVSVARSVRG